MYRFRKGPVIFLHIIRFWKKVIYNFLVTILSAKAGIN